MKILFVLAGVMFGASLAMAQGPCAKDRETLCGNVEKGEGRIMKCMHDNMDKVSAECKAHMEKMKEHMKEAHEACADDVQFVCGGIKPGRGAIMKCLKENKDKLSEGCKAELEKGKKHRRGK